MRNSSLKAFLEGVRQLVANGETDQAVSQLLNFLRSGSGEMYRRLINLAGSLNRLKKDWVDGVLPRDEYEARQARLAKSLLALLDDIPGKYEQDKLPLPADAPEAGSYEGTPDGIAFEQILGINNLKQILWIDRGLRMAGSVCRLLGPASRMGTGFLVAPDLLMTNSHVIPDRDAAMKTTVEFNYQENPDGRLVDTVRYDLDPMKRFHTSPATKLDYTLVAVKPNPDRSPLEKWGHLHLNPNADPRPNEHVVIIQHPNGGPKQIALTANFVMETIGHLIRYTTDTMPGSSGSPVFNDLWHVVAIHHAGGQIFKGADGKSRYANEGILMSAIRADAGPLWPGGASE